MLIVENLNIIQKKINYTAIKVGRNPDTIKLVAASKNVELQRIIEAVNAGVTILGENRVQEALKKISNFKVQSSNDGIEWHLIGPLQKNKAKAAVQLFELIHTIDSAGLAEEVNKHAEKINKIQRILIQVKLSDEETKHGISEITLLNLFEKISTLKNLKLEGLMTMPPFFENPEKTRPYFRQLRNLLDNMNASRIAHYALRELSMGMSHDFEIAIEEGATMVRIGSAIFSEVPR